MYSDIHLQVVDLSCIRQQRPLFANISFTLTAGDALLIEGANGSGKSSLLRLLSGLATPNTGNIFWRGENLQDARAEFAEHMHYIGHTNGIKLGLTVAENLCITQHIHQQTEKNIDATLALLQLSAYKHTQAKYLSAGQKRRIALAKLFLYPKRVWILDEPYTALDTNTQAIFHEKLASHLQGGGIAIISSHHSITVRNARTLRLSA